MRQASIAIIISSIMISASLNGQETDNVYNFNFNKLRPIVQLFGTASYNVENNNYNYVLGRAHIGFQYKFNDKWSSKIIIDRGRPTTFGEFAVTDSAGNSLNVKNGSHEGSYYTMWLKYASLQWKVNDRLTLEGGAVLQNHYITMERFWGLRYISQTFQDLYWHIPSSDLGFIAYYKVNNTISVDAAVTNGEGPRVKQDPFGKVKMAGGININPSRSIQTRFYYHNRQTGLEGSSTEQMFSFFAGIGGIGKNRLGAEFNYMINLNNTSGLDSWGYSVYDIYQIGDDTRLFARLDRLEYNATAALAGLSFSPVEGVSLSLSYKYWNPDDEDGQARNYLLFGMEYKL